MVISGLKVSAKVVIFTGFDKASSIDWPRCAMNEDISCSANDVTMGSGYLVLSNPVGSMYIAETFMPLRFNAFKAVIQPVLVEGVITISEL